MFRIFVETVIFFFFKIPWIKCSKEQYYNCFYLTDLSILNIAVFECFPQNWELLFVIMRLRKQAKMFVQT